MAYDPTRPGGEGILAADTSSEAEQVQVALWREMSASEKAGLVAELTAGARQLSLAGIRRRHPSASEEECRLRYAVRTLGRSMARRAYPQVEALGER